MMIRVYEVLLESGPKIVHNVDGERSVAARVDLVDTELSRFFKAGEVPRRMRLRSESFGDAMTIEGLYASVNNDGLQITHLAAGCIAMRFGYTEFYIDPLVDVLPELPSTVKDATCP